MTDKERQDFITYVDEFVKKMEGNKEMARDFLVKVGIYTRDGNLTEPYKNLYIPRPTI